MLNNLFIRSLLLLFIIFLLKFLPSCTTCTNDDIYKIKFKNECEVLETFTSNPILNIAALITIYNTKYKTKSNSFYSFYCDLSSNKCHKLIIIIGMEKNKVNTFNSLSPNYQEGAKLIQKKNNIYKVKYGKKIITINLNKKTIGIEGDFGDQKEYGKTSCSSRF